MPNSSYECFTMLVFPTNQTIPLCTPPSFPNHFPAISAKNPDQFPSLVIF